MALSRQVKRSSVGSQSSTLSPSRRLSKGRKNSWNCIACTGPAGKEQRRFGKFSGRKISSSTGSNSRQSNREFNETKNGRREMKFLSIYKAAERNTPQSQQEISRIGQIIG